VDSNAAGEKRWTRHGRTHWLWERGLISAAIQDVVLEQGEAMSLYGAEVR
jgi:hypothetical protein